MGTKEIKKWDISQLTSCGHSNPPYSVHMYPDGHHPYGVRYTLPLRVPGHHLGYYYPVVLGSSPVCYAHRSRWYMGFGLVLQGQPGLAIPVRGREG